MPRFRDRREAGQRLAEALHDVGGPDPVVLGVPRGGVVVAHEVAERLGSPLDVVVVRKLGHPRQEEAGFGAVGEQGVLVPEHLAALGPGDPGYEVFKGVAQASRAEVEDRVARYRAGRDLLPIEGKTAIVVDDGIATGYTFAAALAVARKRRPSRLIAAVPVASSEGATLVSAYSDELLVPGRAKRGLFFAVSLYYDEFPQVSDDEVSELLARREAPGSSEG
jgi:putative phosphoribosyl transferase